MTIACCVLSSEVERTSVSGKLLMMKINQISHVKENAIKKKEKFLIRTTLVCFMMVKLFSAFTCNHKSSRDYFHNKRRRII